MDINAGNLGDLATTYKAAFQEGVQSTPDEDLSFMVSDFPSDTSENSYPWLESMPEFREWVGDRVFMNAKARKFDVPNKDYESSVSVPIKAIKDDKYGIYKPMVGMLGAGWIELQLDEIIAVLTGNATCFTGYGICSDSHTYGEHSIDNLTTSALAVATFDAAFEAAGGWKFASGKACKTQFTHLLVGEALRTTAWNIVKNQWAETSTDGGTAAIGNPNQGRVELHVSRRLTGDYANYWFLVDCSRGIKPVVRQIREEASVFVDDSEKTVRRTGQMDVMADGRLACAPTFPHLIYGGQVAA